MIKFTSNNDFDFQVESVSLLRDVSRDLTKRASARDLLRFDKSAGQEDLHIIALGAYEGTGFNRNGDAFSEEDCRKNNHYFKDAGRAIHRHHKNKPNDPKFGNIKAAAYNEPMKRIELIIGLDRDKCADILDEQEKTGNTNWSMASKQAYDVCSWCNHKAKTDKDRCEHIPKNIGELNKHGEMCGMHNPNPRWFEMSYVRRPADRIGMSLGKMASDSSIKPMLPSDYLQLYGDIYVPENILLSKKAADKREVLHKLAEIEKHVEAIARGKKDTAKELFIQRHGAKVKGSQIDGTSMDELRKMEPSQVLKVLADNGILFGPEDFARYLFDKRISSDRISGMKSHLPGIFSKLDKDDAGEVANNEKFEPGEGMTPPSLKNLVSKLHEGHSLSSGPAVRRMMMITICMGGPKDLKPAREEEKSKEAFDQEFAKQYAAYKLAALNYLNDQGKLDEDLMLNAVLQNRA